MAHNVEHMNTCLDKRKYVNTEIRLLSSSGNPDIYRDINANLSLDYVSTLFFKYVFGVSHS